MMWSVAAGVVIGGLCFGLVVAGIFVTNLPHPDDPRLINENAMKIGLAMMVGGAVAAVGVVAKALGYL
jgi:hypothetical protein